MWLPSLGSQIVRLAERGLLTGVIQRLALQATRQQVFPTSQQSRSVVIVKRKHPIGVARAGRQVNLTEDRQFIYEFVKDTQHQTKKNITVILTQDVSGIGLKNDIVSVKKALVRSRLIPEELAVYASPDNLRERALNLKKDAAGPKKLSFLAKETIQHMQSKPLLVYMHKDQEWNTLGKEPILHAFKMDGVFVPEYALKLPDEPITEFGEYTLYVTINGVETVPVEMELLEQKREETEEETVQIEKHET